MQIINAKHLADREGFGTVKDRIFGLSRKFCVKPWAGNVTEKNPVSARIDFGRWIADCECGGAEYVSPDEPLFFCLSCGNTQYEGAARKVVFPVKHQEIEQLVLERPVQEGFGGDDIEKAFKARPIVAGFSRSWNPGESSSDLKLQNQALLSAMKGIK